MNNTLDSRHGTASEQVPAAGTDVPAADEWRRAHELLLQYGAALSLPLQRAQELAAGALRRAQQDRAAHPVAASLQALRQVLEEQADAAPISSMPLLKRGSMLPVDIDRQPWWTFFKKRVLRKK
jgi:hypothetical protein